MYFGLANPELYFYGVLFLIASVFSWFIPGWVVLTLARLKNPVQRFVAAVPTGLALWGIQGYVLGYLGVRFLSVAYILFFALVFVRQLRQTKYADISALWIRLKKQPVWLFILVTLAAFLQAYAHLGSGLRVADGLPFYFVISVDGVMHLSYIQSLMQQFPPQEPGAIDLPLVNYHYWTDLVLADLARIWQVPVLHLFFQYAPLFILFWTNFAAVTLARTLGGNWKTIAVVLFLLTFGSDAAYALTLILHGTWGESTAALDTGINFVFNMPQVFGRLVFVGSLLLLLEWWKQRRWSLGIVTVALIASLFGFKIYYALYAVGGFCSVIAFESLRTFSAYARKNPLHLAVRYTVQHQWQSYLMVALLAVASLVIFLPANSGAGGLVYAFFEWPHVLLSVNNINYQDWFLRMQVYEAAGNTRNILIMNGFAVFLTFIAVYGTRMLGLVPLFRAKNEDWVRLFAFFLPVNLVFLLLGLLTLQVSGGMNIFNFLIVPIFSFILFTAFSVSQLPTKVFLPVFIVLIVTSLPRSGHQLLSTWQRYSVQQTDFLISNQQLEAFSFASKALPMNAVVQALPSDDYNTLSPYLPFFTERSSYLAGIEMLRSHNQPTEERLENLKQALAATTSAQRNLQLQELDITHMILPTAEIGEAGYSGDVPVYHNEEISIYETQ